MVSFTRTTLIANCQHDGEESRCPGCVFEVLIHGCISEAGAIAITISVGCGLSSHRNAYPSAFGTHPNPPQMPVRVCNVSIVAHPQVVDLLWCGHPCQTAWKTALRLTRQRHVPKGCWRHHSLEFRRSPANYTGSKPPRQSTEICPADEIEKHRKREGHDGPSHA